MAQFKIITSLDQNMGIAREGRKPWFLPEEERNFLTVTTKTSSPRLKNALLMDLETWKNLPTKGHPYPERLNVVVGTDNAQGLDMTQANPQIAKAPDLPEGVLYYDSLEDALDELGDRDDLDDLFVIGGEKLFAEAILHPDLEEIHLTRIEENYDCDSFFPAEIPVEFEVASTSEIMESDALEYTFVIMVRSDDSDTDMDIDEEG